MGVEKGDRVLLYMPNILESMVGMLACARLGVIHVVVLGGFASNELAKRIDDAQPKVVLAGHPDVAECAVIGIKDDLKGQLPLGFVVLKAGVMRAEAEIVSELVRRIREVIGPVASFKQACIVKRLPKTRSGKILRGTMRKITDSEEYGVPPTIDDPAILDEIAEVLRRLGHAR